MSLAFSAQGVAAGVLVVVVGGAIALVVLSTVFGIAWELVKDPRRLWPVPVGAGVIGLVGTALTGALLGSILVGAIVGLAAAAFFVWDT